MPYKCCIPGCPSNKYEGHQYVSVFRFPSDAILRDKWTKVIPRINFVPTKYSCVCLRHFNQSDIQTQLTTSANVAPPPCRQRPKLKSGAIPVIYPENPAYFVRQTNGDKERVLKFKEQKSYDAKMNEIASNNLITTYLEDYTFENSDKIRNFTELKSYVEENSVRSDLNWQRICSNESICFFVVNITDRPCLEVSVTISTDLRVRAWRNNIIIRPSVLREILGPDTLCDKYSKLLNMLKELRVRGSCKPKLTDDRPKKLILFDEAASLEYNFDDQDSQDRLFDPILKDCEIIILE